MLDSASLFTAQCRSNASSGHGCAQQDGARHAVIDPALMGGRLCRCLVALYFVGADKAPMQAALAAAGAVAPVVRLCRSSQPEVQAEATDVLKVLARHPRASRVIVDLGEPTAI